MKCSPDKHEMFELKGLQNVLSQTHLQLLGGVFCDSQVLVKIAAVL